MFVFLGILSIIGWRSSADVPKKLIYENRVYEKEIKSVRLFGLSSSFQREMLPAATPLRQANLMLEFDDLRSDMQYYYARVIHCNFDWTPSTLSDLDYLIDYNEFNVNEYAYSGNTHIPYVHYTFKLPPVKLPGNYLLIVYRDGDKNDLILSHRFMIYDNQASLLQDHQAAGSLTLQANNQQLNFTVNYKGVDIVNPMESVHVVIRQNHRWDNARINVKPSFIREDRTEIEYRLFDEDKFFMAGNEFRFFDFRSANFPGINTARIEKSRKPYHLYIQPDLQRKDQAYAIYQDLNGGYYIENLDLGDAQTDSQYVYVTFTLHANEIPSAKVYVLGAFNLWTKDDASRMSFDKSVGAYALTTLLKQGWYNYHYWVEGNDLSPLTFEGSYFQTENFYEVLFYYRPFQPNADLLIGYFPVPVNPR